jgi:squalene monooxygenase
MWDAYARALPESLRPAFRSALERRPIAWAANQFRPRSHYGREGLALVGDAVGHFHPLTAVGLTLGFQDADSLSAATRFAAYEDERSRQSLVAELLATALFEALTLPDGGTRAVRQAIYRLWRRDPGERARTMRFLSAQDTDLGEFRWTVGRVLGLALEGLVHETAANHQWSRALRVLKELGGWLEWLPAGAPSRSFAASPRPGSPATWPGPPESEERTAEGWRKRYEAYRAIAQAGK